jgi:hypothetical protein
MYIDAIDESSNTFGSGVIDAFSIHGTSMANTGKEKATKKPKTELEKELVCFPWFLAFTNISRGKKTVDPSYTYLFFCCKIILQK